MKCLNEPCKFLWWFMSNKPKQGFRNRQELFDSTWSKSRRKIVWYLTLTRFLNLTPKHEAMRSDVTQSPVTRNALWFRIAFYTTSTWVEPVHHIYYNFTFASHLNCKNFGHSRTKAWIWETPDGKATGADEVLSCLHSPKSQQSAAAATTRVFSPRLQTRHTVTRKQKNQLDVKLDECAEIKITHNTVRGSNLRWLKKKKNEKMALFSVWDRFFLPTGSIF